MNPDTNQVLLPSMEKIWQETLQWQPDVVQHAKFQQLYTLIQAGNHQLNLTRITAPEEFWEKHLWDSLRGIFPHYAESSAQPLRIIDIGTGAGFPGVPVAIAHPHWQVTLLDSTRKKMAFLDTMLTALNLFNAKTQVDRAEQVGQHPAYRERYDLVLIRAVAAVAVCAEYALPLLKRGGAAVLYRGQWTQAEDTSLPNIAAQLGGAVEMVEQFTTPLTQSMRHCVYLRKCASTPITFPRPVGIPAHHPLA